MKRIFTILVCVLAIVGATSCGNSGSNKETDAEALLLEEAIDKNLSKDEKKALSAALDDFGIDFKEKGNQIIKTSSALGSKNIEIYTFKGDKCTGYRIICTMPEAQAKEVYEVYQNTLVNVKLDGNTVSGDYNQETLDLVYGSMTKAQIREKVKQEVEDSKKLLKSLKRRK
ncbi:hypothetical protein [Parabacteroides sp.]